jgi:hypothetical protein
MLKLTVEVPQARDRTAFAELRDGARIVANGHAVATATVSYASQRANPACDPLRPSGHPPLGRYRLIHQQPTPPPESAEYGKHLLLFEPESGPALEAESFGRLALLAYGGPAHRRTQGGLRLSDDLLDTLVSRLSAGEELTLELSTLRPRAWWQFWKATPIALLPLAGDSNVLPPRDELALIDALLKKTVRRVRHRDTRDDSAETRETSDRSSARSSGEVFQGKGGESGGAGASGRWSEGPGSGVDNSGRIIAAATAAGAAAVLTAMAVDAAETSDAAGDGNAGESDSSAGTATDTAY